MINKRVNEMIDEIAKGLMKNGIWVKGMMKNGI
jgi:hypothetical protein